MAVALGLLVADRVWAHDPKHKGVVGPVSPAETAAYERAKPALERHCFRCHTTTGKKAKRKTLAHLNFDSYPPKGHHAHEAGAATKRVLEGDPTKKGKRSKPTMPSDKPGVVVGDDLKLILKWADAFDKAHFQASP